MKSLFLGLQSAKSADQWSADFKKAGGHLHLNLRINGKRR
jgi:hypothetical protein